MLNSAGQSVVTPDVESYHLLYDNFVGMTYNELKLFFLLYLFVLATRRAPQQYCIYYIIFSTVYN